MESKNKSINFQKEQNLLGLNNLCQSEYYTQMMMQI